MPTIVAVGDLNINRDDPDSAFVHVREILQSSDIAFAQLETPYSDKGSKGSSGPRGSTINDPRSYPAIPHAGFNVISVASNHIMDHGEDALLDVIARLRADGISPVGAGIDLEEARRPAYFERDGVRIAFLAYCSVAPKGYYAAPKSESTIGRAGVAPMRAITHYEPIEEDQPGTPCEIMTIPNARDLECLISDVKEARDSADVVAVSFHWGIHGVKGVIADYQPVVAHTAIDAGADVIIGHHPHILKGIEVYTGKVIFYSVGNFVFDPAGRPKNGDPVLREQRERIYKMMHRIPERDLDSAYTFQSDSKYSMIAKIAIKDKRIEQVSFVPVIINKQATPEPLWNGDPRRQDVVTYLEESICDARLNASLRDVGNEIVIETDH